MLKQLWKPLALILVIGIMAVDLILDRRVTAQVQAESGANSALADLPVGTNTGELAPDFIATTLDGETVKLSDLRGKVVLVNLFASWCGPCRAEAPHLVEAYNQANHDEIVIIGLNLQETPEAVAAFRDDFGIPFPLVLDEDGRLTKTIYQPIGLPTSWFIDQDGVVRFVFAGAMTQEMLNNILEDVQSGREPDPFG